MLITLLKPIVYTVAMAALGKLFETVKEKVDEKLAENDQASGEPNVPPCNDCEVQSDDLCGCCQMPYCIRCLNRHHERTDIETTLGHPCVDRAWPIDIREGFETNNDEYRNLTVWKDGTSIGGCCAVDPVSRTALRYRIADYKAIVHTNHDCTSTALSDQGKPCGIYKLQSYDNTYHYPVDLVENVELRYDA